MNLAFWFVIRGWFDVGAEQCPYVLDINNVMKLFFTANRFSSNKFESENCEIQRNLKNYQKAKEKKTFR